MTTAMHFGPEWMRTKQQVLVRPHNAPSPPPPSTLLSNPNTPTPPGVSSYSALVTPPSLTEIRNDISHPFKYSKIDMLRIWKDGGGRGSLPIEVERWDGVVREVYGEPMGVREQTDAEKKVQIYSASLNSDLRRRQSTDFSQSADRTKLHGGGGGGLNSPLRESFAGLLNRRKKGDGIEDNPTLTIHRKSSWSAVNGPLGSPGLASPRARLSVAHGSGFDGVLNGGDSWSSPKRRLSASSPFNQRFDMEGDDDRAALIKEEEEDQIKDEGGTIQPSLLVTTDASTSDSKRNVQPFGLLAIDPFPGKVDVAPAMHDPPVETDFRTIQWTYLDPMGNIQGPFPAATMQIWHDQMYFTDDLRMKRAQIDPDWMLVAEIKRRALGEQIFLSPLSELLPPPGLSRQPDGPHSFAQANFLPHPNLESPLNLSMQQIPQSSNVESYLNGISTRSDSPSSLSAGGFSRQSFPMSNTGLANTGLGNRVLNSEITFTGRSGSFSRSDSPAASLIARRAYNDSPDSTLGKNMDIHQSRFTVFDSPVLSTSSAMSGHSYQPVGSLNSGYAGGYSDGNSNFNQANGKPPVEVHSTAVPSTNNSPIHESTYYPSSVNGTREFGGNHRTEFNTQSNAEVNVRFLGTQVSNIHEDHTFSQPLNAVPPLVGLSNSPVKSDPSAGSNAVQRSPFSFQPRPSPSQSPWGTVEHAMANQPSILDGQPPTSNDIPQPSAIPSWIAPLPAKESNEVVGKENSGDGWDQTTEEPQKLTFELLTQHNQLQEQTPSTGGLDSPEMPEDPPAKPSTTSPLTTGTNPVTSTSRDHTIRVPKRQTSTQSKMQPILPVSAPLNYITSQPSPSTSPASQPKVAWSTDDDPKKPKSSTVIGFRELQEAEERKQDAKRSVEKEKERLARVVSPTTLEEVAFTATWGLPISQVGSRPSPHISKVSTAAAPSPPAPASPVPAWTNAAKSLPIKKSMKEIQEEEEKRKKNANATKERETIAMAAKRAHADTIGKSPSSQGGAWTTVGVGGKATPTPTSTQQPASFRPVSNSTSVPSASTITSNQPPKPLTSATASVKSSAHMSKVSTSSKPEEPAPPSLELLKWMRESMKGLKSSVQFEEIAQMLLSFPLDPDASTIELIEETIYGATTTLDGRRFAAELIAKRKADAASHPRDVVAGSGKTSLADVVKTQPKPSQSEWGYKVVKKKGKNLGRT